MESFSFFILLRMTFFLNSFNSISTKSLFILNFNFPWSNWFKIIWIFWIHFFSDIFQIWRQILIRVIFFSLKYFFNIISFNEERKFLTIIVIIASFQKWFDSQWFWNFYTFFDLTGNQFWLFLWEHLTGSIFRYIFILLRITIIFNTDHLTYLAIQFLKNGHFFRIWK